MNFLRINSYSVSFYTLHCNSVRHRTL